MSLIEKFSFNYDKILFYFFVFICVFFLGVMGYKAYNETQPEQQYQNYKKYVTDSVKIWVKNRDNQFYDKENIINWYEKADRNGNKPMDLFPPVIYSNIKEAINLTFGKYAHIKEPDKMEEIISQSIELNKQNIINQLDKKNN